SRERGRKQRWPHPRTRMGPPPAGSSSAVLLAVLAALAVRLVATALAPRLTLRAVLGATLRTRAARTLLAAGHDAVEQAEDLHGGAPSFHFHGARLRTTCPVQGARALSGAGADRLPPD